MLKFNEEEILSNMRAALALRPEMEKILDQVEHEGIRNVCWLGIGGTWASCMQAVVLMKERSAREVFALNAAEYNTTGDRRVGKGTFIVISSVTGTTEEMIAAVRKSQEAGAKVLGFVNKVDTPLADMVDWCLTAQQNEQLKFFMVADYLMHLEGVFPDYEKCYQQIDTFVPEGIVAIEKSADDFGRSFAEKHKADALHYFVGAGTLYGATYSYAMCYWEEMHWRRTKSIHSAEFFHGMLEIIDEDTPVTVFIAEDSQRELGLRVKRFLEHYNRNYTIIDTADYPLEGLDPAYRSRISHMIMHAVTNRIDAHMSDLNQHDMSLRRYYRTVKY